MKKSFTRLLGLVMLFGFLAFQAAAEGVVIPPTVKGAEVKSVWPEGATAYTKTTDKALVIYNQDVIKSTGSIRLTNLNTGALVRVIPASDSRVSVAKGDTVEIDLSGDLKELTAYKVAVDVNAFKAADGTPASFEGNATWGWMTGDYTAPTLESVWPEDGDVVDNNTISLVLTFKDGSEIVKGSGKITVYKADGNVWDLKVLNFGVGGNAVIAGDVLTVSGIRQLEDLVDYQVTIDAGIVTDEGLNVDEEGIPYAGESDRTKWTFSTEDFTSPEWAANYPKKANVGSDAFDVLVKLTEAGTVYALLGDAEDDFDAETVRDANNSVDVAAGAEGSFTFDELDESTEYVVYLVADNGDTPGTVVKTVTVTTGETVDPVLVSVKYDYSSSSDDSHTLTSFNLVPYNNDVELDLKKVRLTFDEEVKLGAGSILVKRVKDNSVFATVASTSMVTDADGGNWIEFPLSGLQNRVDYYVVIPNTLVFDVYGNNYGGITSILGWKFTSSDDVAPTYQITPAHAAANVPKNQKIVLTFDEVVVAGAAWNNASVIELRNKDNNPINFTYSVANNDGKFTVVTLTPTTVPVNSLPSGELVRVIIHEDNITDNSPDANEVSGETSSVAFFVEDYKGPYVSGWEPSNGSLTSSTTAIKIKYNEGIYLAGGTELTASNLYTILTVKKGTSNGANVAANFAISTDKKTITITPATAWASGQAYFIGVSSGVEDMYGNAYDDTNPLLREKTFTVNDLVAETVVVNVAGKVISTGDDITIKFNNEARSKVFDGTTGAFENYTLARMEDVVTLKLGDANGPDVPFTLSTTDAITFAVDAPSLVGNETYYIGVGPSTKDAAGNVNVPKFVTFSTLYEDAPELVSLSPENDAKEVEVDDDVVVTFNCEIELVSEANYDLSAGITINGNKVAYADLDVDGATLTINHEDFDENETYAIVISDDIILNVDDASGILFFEEVDTWSFETVDTELLVTGLKEDSKLDGATDVAIDAVLVITFGEDVEAASGNIDIRNSATNAIVERILVTSANVEIDGNVVTITPSANFNYDTDYYVEVDADAFVDAVGNGNDAIFGNSDEAGNYDWIFTTEDPDLAIVSVTPDDGADKIGLTSSIIVEFNRLIAFGTGSIGYVEDEDGDLSQQVYPVGSSNLTISGKKLTITHTDKNFPEDARIWLSIDATSITVATDVNNSLSANVNEESGADSWSFYTYDVNPPMVATWSPEDGDEEVALDAVITITFDEEIYHANDGTSFNAGEIATSGIFTIWNEDLDEEVTFIGGISGNVVTLTPDVDLDEFTNYSVTIAPVDGDGIADALEQVIGDESHIMGEESITFTTADLTGPTVALNMTGGSEKVTVSGITVTDANPNKLYYLIREKTADAAPTAAQIKANNKSKTSFANFDIEGLAASTTYQLFYYADDDYGNISVVGKKEANTDDTVAPVLVSSDPASGDVDVEINEAGEIEIELTFSEDVERGTGDIKLREKNTNAIVATYSAATALDDSDDDEVLVLTLTGLPTDKSVLDLYVEMAEGTVVDLANTPNNFGGIYGANAIYFSTADNLLPTVALDDNTLNTNQNIVLKFSENVQPGTGKAILYKTEVLEANAVEVFDAADVVFNGKLVTLNPVADLDNDATYKVVVGDDFGLDLSANENGNIETTLTLTVDVNEAPGIENIYIENVGNYGPDEEISNIDKDNLEYFDITFTEAVYFKIDGIKTSILLLTDAQIKANDILSIVDMDGNAVPFTINQDDVDNITFYVDADDFEHATEYTITIKGLMDSDEAVITPLSFSFSTTDGIAPVATFDPEDETEDVDENTVLTISFSEKIYHWVSGSIDEEDFFFYEPFDSENIDDIVYLKDDEGNDVEFDATFDGVSVITITPAEQLESGMTYRYGYDSDNVVDEDDNGADGDDFAEFTVRDYLIPTFDDEADVTPTKGEEGIDADADMAITWSEEIVVSTGKVVIRNLDGTIFETLGGEKLSIDDDGMTLIIDHSDFAADAEYFVELEASVVTDKAGNPSAAYGDAINGWIFTTKDTYKVEATVNPLGDNQPNVVNLQMTFNKKVMLNTETDFGYRMAVYKEDGTAVLQTNVNQLVILNNVVSLFGVELEADQSYYARVEPNAFKDASGNKFAGIMDNSWVFSTIDNQAPVVDVLMPADNSTDVDPATSFSITFDREIAVGTGMIAVRKSVDGTLFEEVNVTDATIVGNTLSFELSSMLEPQTGYYVIVPAGAVTNTEAGLDPFAGILNTYTWNFSTGDVVIVPEIESLSPDEETIADNHPTFVMTFVEDVMWNAAGNIYVTEANSASAKLTIAITEDMIAGNVVTIPYVYDTLVGGLELNADYFVTVDANVFKNAEGNTFEGISDATEWTFTTGDTVATATKPVVDIDFNVYPNPFNDHLYIDNYEKLVRVVVANIAGQRVIDVKYPEREIRTGALVSGVYLVTLFTEKGMAKTQRIVKR